MVMQFDNDAIKGFLGHLVLQGVSDNTLRGYGSDLRAVLDWAGPGNTSENLEEVCAQYLNAVRADMSPSTVNRRLTSIRAFGNWVTKQQTGFLASYKAPKRGPGVAHPLPGGMEDIIKMYVVAYHPHHQALVILIGMMGLRVSEARAARLDHFDDSSGEVMLTVRGKGDKTRHVPVLPNVQALLNAALVAAAERRDRRLVPMSDRGARAMWTRLGRRAGLSNPTATHDGRMTFGTTVYAKTKDLRAAQELLGHSDPSTTQGYTGISEATKRAAADIL